LRPTLTKNGSDQILVMRLKTAANEYLEYKYVLKADYMLDFDINSQGLNKVLNVSKPLQLEWDLKSYTNEKVLVMKIVILNCTMSIKMGKAIIWA
jgi:YidC/Oxa1 family membrane protein insertase